MDDHATDPLRLNNLFGLPLDITFDQPETSTNGGAVLLHGLAQRMGLIEAFSNHIEDTRDPAKVQHTIDQIIAQRLYGLACGYEDCNDSAALANDPALRLVGKSDRQANESLASQPTLSRIENQMDGQTLFAIGSAMAERVLDYQKRLRKKRRKPKRITIDLDPTDDPTHGQQIFTFFHGHYRHHCFLPILGFVSFDNESEQYLLTSMLRPGDAHPTHNAAGLIRRLVEAVRQRWPKAKVRVRLDGGFAAPHIFDLLEHLKVEYVVAMASNERLAELADPSLQEARRLFERDQQTWQVFKELEYQAHSWSKPRRVVAKAEVVHHPGRAPRDNVRFVVTNMRQRPDRVYQFYQGRGDSENRIKELLDDMGLDRTSCHRFEANAFRNLLSAAAYMLMQAMRDHLRHTRFASAQVQTLRHRLLKVAARLRISCRRIHLSLPETFPDADVFAQLARLIGAGLRWQM